jgi:hypothetical protein
MGLKFQGTV